MKSGFKKLLTTDIKGIPHEYQVGAFLIPVFLLLVTFISKHIHPFGNGALLTCDLYYQMAPILAELKHKIVSGESLFFTWNIGLGMNFWPAIAYYAASPLNLLLLLCPQKFIYDGIAILILLRAGLSGLFFSLLIYKKDKKEGPRILALSTAYALCGYVLSYFWVVMWMDAIVLLPLILLGLWKIFTGGKPHLYIVTLFLAIFSNFYTAFFICIFLVLFAPILYLEAHEKRSARMKPLRAGLAFAGYSLLSAGLSAVLLLPTLIALKNTSAASDSISWLHGLSFPFFDFLERFLLHAEPVIRSGLPNVYCGVVLLILIPMYALCAKIPMARRAASLALAFFLYLSMSYPFLDFLWNGMHGTNQIPYRQAFLLSFLLLYMASDLLLNFEGTARNTVFFSSGAVLVYLILLNRSGGELIKNYWLIYGSAALVILYSVILAGFYSNEKRRLLAEKLFLYVMIIELFVAAEFAFSYIDKTESFTYAPSFGAYADEISADLSESDGDQFYRTCMVPEMTGNDGALFHYKTLSVFSSTAPEQGVAFLSALGFNTNQCNDAQTGGLTEVSARLLGIRNTVSYTVAEDQTEDNANSAWNAAQRSASGPSEEKNAAYTGYTISTNGNVLPLGFLVPAAGIGTTADPSLSPFERTNTLVTAMGGEPVYREEALIQTAASGFSSQAEDGSYLLLAGYDSANITFEPDIDGPDKDVLIYIGSAQNKTVRVTRTDLEMGTIDSTYLKPLEGQIINLGPCPEKGKERMSVQITFGKAGSESMNICCYTIDSDALDAVTEKFAANPYKITSYDSSYINGTTDFTGSGYLFTTVPYDKGWTVKIDGETVLAEPAYGSMMSVPVTAGHHEITFSYEPPGLKAGLIVTCFAAADYAAIFLLPRLILNSRKKRAAIPVQAGENIDDQPWEKEERQ